MFGEKLNALSASPVEEYKVRLKNGKCLLRIKGNFNLKCEVAIILPTYCEAENIEKIINEIENLGLNCLILVIDDSSPDGTAEKVLELQKRYKNIILYQRPEKWGLGSAISDGFKFLLSLRNPPRYVITMDSDLSHNPKEIPKLLRLARRGYDLVIGSRYCEGGSIEKWSIIRVIISKVANLFASTVFRIGLHDCTSGFRCYSKRLLEKIANYLHSRTYEIQIETVKQATENGFYLVEVPITFVNRKTGKSKLTLNEIKDFISYVIMTKMEDYMKILIPKWNLMRPTPLNTYSLLCRYEHILSSLKRSAL